MTIIGENYFTGFGIIGHVYDGGCFFYERPYPGRKHVRGDVFLFDPVSRALGAVFFDRYSMTRLSVDTEEHLAHSLAFKYWGSGYDLVKRHDDTWIFSSRPFRDSQNGALWGGPSPTPLRAVYHAFINRP